MDIAKKQNDFVGKSGFVDYISRHCHISCKTDHMVLRDVLYSQYTEFCNRNEYPIASIVNIGRYLGNLGVHASTRVGGMKGAGQKYAYVGLTCDCTQATTSPRQSLPNSSAQDTLLPTDNQNSDSSHSSAHTRRSIRPRHTPKSLSEDFQYSSGQDPLFSEDSFFIPSDKDADSSDDEDPDYTLDQDLVASSDHKTQYLSSSTDSSSPDFSLKKNVHSFLSENHPSSSYQNSLSLSSQNCTFTSTPDSLSFLTNNIFSLFAENPILSLNQRYNACLATAERKEIEKQKKLKGGVKNFVDFLQQHYKVTGKPKHKVPREELYERYKEYCATNDYPVISLYSVSRFLGKQKVRANANVGGKRVYVGLKRLDETHSDTSSSCSSSPSSEPDLFSVSTMPLPDPYFSLVTQPLHGIFFPSKPFCPPDSVYRYATVLRLQQEGVVEMETTEWRIYRSSLI